MLVFVCLSKVILIGIAYSCSMLDLGIYLSPTKKAQLISDLQIMTGGSQDFANLTLKFSVIILP